jgi:hypothetical protein
LKHKQVKNAPLPIPHAEVVNTELEMDWLEILNKPGSTITSIVDPVLVLQALKGRNSIRTKVCFVDGSGISSY